MIGRRLGKGQAEECFKGQPIIDLIFEFRIGVDPEPFLKQQAFEQKQGRVGVGTLTAGSYGVVREQELFDTAPIDGSIDGFHEF